MFSKHKLALGSKELYYDFYSNCKGTISIVNCPHEHVGQGYRYALALMSLKSPTRGNCLGRGSGKVDNG